MVSLAGLGSDASLSFSAATAKAKHTEWNEIMEYKSIILKHKEEHDKSLT